MIGDEARDRVNQSEIHLDFMIGSEELKVTGVTADGEHVPVLVEGHWQDLGPRRRSAVRWPVQLVLVALIWGASFMFIKVELDAGIAPLHIALLRCVFGAAALLAMLAFTRDRLPRDRGLYLHLLVLAALMNAVPFVLFAYGETEVSSLLAGIFNSLTPLMTLLFSLVVLPDEPPTPERVAGIAVGFAGVLVVLAPWEGIGGGSLLGALACIGAATCYGVAFPYLRRHLTGRPETAVAISAAQVSLGGLLLLPVAPLDEPAGRVAGRRGVAVDPRARRARDGRRLRPQLQRRADRGRPDGVDGHLPRPGVRGRPRRHDPRRAAELARARRRRADHRRGRARAAAAGPETLYPLTAPGEVPERLNGHDWKSCDGGQPRPRVRIPPSPLGPCAAGPPRARGARFRRRFGDAERGEPLTEEMRVPFAVLLEGVAVEGAAVELDDQALVSVQHVDLLAGDLLVDLGSWEVVAVDEAEELVFEVGAGRARVVVLVADEVADARFVHGSGEGVAGQDAGQVVEGAGRGGDGDAVVAGDVGAGEGGGAVARMPDAGDSCAP